VVPRANTISTSGHGSASAVGRWINAIGSAHAAAAAAPTIRVILCALVVSMLVCRIPTDRCHMPEYINPPGSYFCRMAASRSRLAAK
jgi:hypothetical protein